MFGVVLILAVTLMHVYVFARAVSVPWVRRRVPSWRLVAGALALWLLFVLGRLAGGALPAGPLPTVLEAVTMTWMGTLFLTTVALLAVDAVTIFGVLFGGVAASLRGAALVVGVVLALVALVQGLRAPVVQDYEVTVADLPATADGTVIVALSDLHLGDLLGKQWLQARVAQVQAQRPDLVVLLGDVFEGHGTPDPDLLAVLQHLSAPLGVWAVLGNHEFYGPDGIVARFQAVGIQVLRNAAVTLKPGLVLAGIEETGFAWRAARPDLARVKGLGSQPATATILLSHAPLQPEALTGRGVDLVLAGHTHGGQIWPFGYLVQRYYPMLVGRYELSGTTVIVSRGTGTWGPRMRLWFPGEIVRVTLRRPHAVAPAR